MKLFIQNYDRQGRGFTLIELLIALSITGIVITLTGTGLYTLMRANETSQSETMDRLELEQALDFMTNEIKMSQQVATNIPALPTMISGFRSASGSSHIQPILVLNPAINSGLTNPIVYYLADPPNSSVWLGPKVIYRWGPTLLQNGHYSDGHGADVSHIPQGSSLQYYNEVLVDRMGDRVAAQATVGCESDYTYAAPSLTDRVGFYACIASDRKSVKLWMYKQPNSSGRTQSVNALVSTRSN
jgi:prepilin-type N-terminal cleavage/methylation domain-containing protein